METNQEYYARRAAEERKAATTAMCPEARLSHKMLAERYSAMVRHEHQVGDDSASSD